MAPRASGRQWERMKKIDGQMLKVNFVIYYDIDGMEAKQVLRLDEYSGDEEGSWVMLEVVDG